MMSVRVSTVVFLLRKNCASCVRAQSYQPTRRRLSLVNSDLKNFEADGMVHHEVKEEVKSNLKVARVRKTVIRCVAVFEAKEKTMSVSGCRAALSRSMPASRKSGWFL